MHQSPQKQLPRELDRMAALEVLEFTGEKRVQRAERSVARKFHYREDEPPRPSRPARDDPPR